MSTTPESMHVVTSALLLQAKTLETQARAQYQRADLATGCWCMIDLKSSAAFRLEAGDLESFTRLHVFSRLVATLADASEGVEVFKELGDGVLVRATSARSLMEILCVLDGVSRYWQRDSDIDPTYPNLSSRAAVTMGECFAYKGDYFGTPIDRVARISAYKSTKDSLLAIVDETFRSSHESRLRRELPFLSFGVPTPAPLSLLKTGEPPFLICEVSLDRAQFGRFEKYFAAARMVRDRLVAGPDAVP